MKDDPTTVWEQTMRPAPSVAFGLAHYAAELFGSLIVIASTFSLIASVVLIGGGTGGAMGDRLTGIALGLVAVKAFGFGRHLITEHSVSLRRFPNDDDGGGGGGQLPTPLPVGPSVRERHVAAGRSPLTRRPSPGRRQPAEQDGTPVP